MKPVPGKETRLAWKINGIFHQHANFAQVVLAGQGLHYGQPRIMFTIKDLEGASQKEIADELQVTPASLAMSLKRLQKGGFLERSVGLEDQRVNKIRLTEKGLRSIVVCHRQMQWIDHQMMAGFSEQEKDVLSDFLARIQTNLDACRIEDLNEADKLLPDDPAGQPDAQTDDQSE